MDIKRVNLGYKSGLYGCPDQDAFPEKKNEPYSWRRDFAPQLPIVWSRPEPPAQAGPTPDADRQCPGSAAWGPCHRPLQGHGRAKQSTDASLDPGGEFLHPFVSGPVARAATAGEAIQRIGKS